MVKLPYKLGDLSPVLSKNNVDYHYNVLTKAYVRRYNEGEGDPDFNYGGAKLHNLFWSQLHKRKPGNKPSGAIKELINKNVYQMCNIEYDEQSGGEMEGNTPIWFLKQQEYTNNVLIQMV